MYNVTITSLDQCGQNYILKLYYSESVIMKVLHAAMIIILKFLSAMCEDPASISQIVNSKITVYGYETPALEGHVVNFSCSFGQVLTGSNMSTCMRDGEWEPDPKEMSCDSNITTTISNSPHFQITGILVGSLLGILLLLIAMTTIVTFLLKGRIKGL